MSVSGFSKPLINGIEWILFDFNDVLSPSNHMSVFKQNEDRLGMSAETFVGLYTRAGLLDELLKGKFASETEFWREVSELLKLDHGFLLSLRHEIEVTRTINWPLMEYIITLKQRYKLALLTNNYRETFRSWVEKFRLAEVFDEIFNSADYGMMKPDPRFFQAVIKNMMVSPARALLVDDNIENLVSAARLGFWTIQYLELDDLKRAMIQHGVHI